MNHIDLPNFSFYYLPWLCTAPQRLSLLTNGRTCVAGFVHGSCSSEASRRCSGFIIQVNFVIYLFLAGVREVPEASHTSTANDNVQLEHTNHHINLIWCQLH